MPGSRLLLLLCLTAACSQSAPRCEEPTASCIEPSARVVLTHGSTRLEVAVAVADTQAARVQGLRGVTELAPRTGMLFVFEETAPRTFTMADTVIPLDLLMIAGGRVVEIIDLIPCPGTGVSCEYPTRPAEAALELPAGTTAAAGIGVGALVEAGSLL